MGTIKKTITLAILSIVIALPTTAHALGGSDAYAGVAAGQGTLVIQSGPNETAVGYKILAGLHATGPFYAEVSHVNLGTYFKDTTSELEVSGNALHVAGKLPFTASVYALARVGLFSWDMQYANANVSRTGTDTAYGFTLGWAMPMGYTVRLDWDHYSNIGKFNTYSGNDMTLVSLGISLHF